MLTYLYLTNWQLFQCHACSWLCNLSLGRSMFDVSSYLLASLLIPPLWHLKSPNLMSRDLIALLNAALRLQNLCFTNFYSCQKDYNAELETIHLTRCCSLSPRSGWTDATWTIICLQKCLMDSILEEMEGLAYSPSVLCQVGEVSPNRCWSYKPSHGPYVVTA